MEDNLTKTWADRGAREVPMHAPPDKQKAAHEMARARYRAAWRNFIVGGAVLVAVVVAVVWLSAAVTA